MRHKIFWTLILVLTFNYFNGQTSPPFDSTIKIRGHGPTTYFIDGFKVHSKFEKGDSLKILRQTADRLNGFWVSKEDSNTVRFIISPKTLRGQMLMPYEKIQQTQPVSLRLAYNEDRILSIFTSNDTIRLRVNDAKLSLEEKNFAKKKSDNAKPATHNTGP